MISSLTDQFWKISCDFHLPAIVVITKEMKTCFSSSPRNPLLHLLFFAVFLLFLSSFASSVVVMSNSGKSDGIVEQTVDNRAVHIVYTERLEDEEPESYHVRTLASILGSEEAARNALVYSYRTAVSGFSAKLTPKQVAEISKLPGVLQVVPSRTISLHSKRGHVHI